MLPWCCPCTSSKLLCQPPGQEFHQEAAGGHKQSAHHGGVEAKSGLCTAANKDTLRGDLSGSLGVCNAQPKTVPLAVLRCINGVRVCLHTRICNVLEKRPFS